jgi:hypothetical protein
MYESNKTWEDYLTCCGGLIFVAVLGLFLFFKIIVPLFFNQ